MFSSTLNSIKTQHGDETYASCYGRVIGTGLALLSTTTRKLGKVNKNKFSAIGKLTLQNYDSQEKGTNEMIFKISLPLSSLKIIIIFLNIRKTQKQCLEAFSTQGSLMLMALQGEACTKLPASCTQLLFYTISAI